MAYWIRITYIYTYTHTWTKSLRPLNILVVLDYIYIYIVYPKHFFPKVIPIEYFFCPQGGSIRLTISKTNAA